MNNNEYFGQFEGVVTVNGTALDPRLDLRNHSPTGFSWGYGGSGVAQLALAVLAHEYNPRFALANYQGFKWKVFALYPQSKNWRLTSAEIRGSFSRRARSRSASRNPTASRSGGRNGKAEAGNALPVRKIFVSLPRISIATVYVAAAITANIRTFFNPIEAEAISGYNDN